MATDKEVKLEQNEFYEPTEADKELTDFVNGIYEETLLRYVTVLYTVTSSS